jgi:hypothetical protein
MDAASLGKLKSLFNWNGIVAKKLAWENGSN